MSTPPQQINKQIQKIKLDINRIEPGEKTIYDEIREFREKIDDFKPRSRAVAEQIEELHEIEKELLDKISGETAVINFLSSQLIKAVKKKAGYEDHVRDIKSTILKLCNNQN